MPVKLGTITGLIPYVVERGIRDLATHGNNLEAQVAALAARPAPTIDLDAIRSALSSSGATPLNVYQLLGGSGSGGTVLYGVHAERTATSPESVPAGTLFVETDRHAVYVTDASASWVLIVSYDVASIALRPTDLTVTDVGFVFVDTEANNRWYWNGTGWAWIGGGPTRGTLVPNTKPVGFGAIQTGYLFYAIDFDRVYRWSGAAWQDAPGQDARGQFGFFNNLFGNPPGWGLCNGGTYTMSRPDGSTQPITLPNLIGEKRFLRASNNVGIEGGNANNHVHFVDPPVTTTGPPSDTSAVGGSGNQAASRLHTHQVDIPLFFSGAPTVTDDALPPFYEAQLYFRL